jgi:hypothetical protein
MAGKIGSRHEYLREFDQFFGAYRKGCADLGIDYKVMNTNSNLELALSEYLYQRSRLY